MPRNGSGVYSLPPGSTFTPNTLIQSSVVNGINNDLATDLNTPRPIVAGGTGSATKNFDDIVVYATKTTNYTAVVGDNNAVHRFSATATLSLSAASTLGSGWHYKIIADGGRVTIDPNASETINGVATLIVESGQNALIVCDGTQFFAAVSGTPAAGLFLQGFLYGLTLSNDPGDLINDIAIAAGEAASDGAIPALMNLSSSITKRLDANWAVGTNQGGLDTGSIANTTYHVWLIQRSDTGVVDALFSTSATAPTMPTNYDRKRRIGSIIRESAAIVAFNQAGDVFRRAAKVDRSSTSALASTLLTISIPAGIQVQPILQSELTVTAANSSVQNAVGSAFEGSASITFQATLLPGTAGADTDRQVFPPVVFSNTSSQIYYAVTVAAGSINSNTLSTIGWIDRRGRL